MNADMKWLDNPEVFRVNQLDAHSDHCYYMDYADMEKSENPLMQSLNGQWEFAFSKNVMDRPENFYEENFDASSFDKIMVPGHIELAGYDKIRYINTMYPWEGKEYHRGAYSMESTGDEAGMFSEAEYNPVGSYIKRFDLSEQMREKKICICFEGVEEAMYLWLNGQFVGYAEDSFTPSEFDLTPFIREKGNVHQHLDLIAGLPYENYESFGHSFNEVYAMHPDQLQLGFLKVLHGSFMYDNAEAYGLVWQDRPPYEVLFTDWLPYGDVIRLKKVEEMVEVHYNSGQFANTMEHLVKEFPSPFDLYVELGEYYEKNGLFGINHSRLARYENLWQFIRTQIPDRADSYREWLTLDLYLRENVKNRPAFAGENQVTKEEMTAFYREETETHRYLKEYDGFDARQLRKMTHLEKIDGKYLLFDYRNRSRLSQNAATYEVCFSNE